MNFRGLFSVGFSALSLCLFLTPASQAARMQEFWSPLEKIDDEMAQEDLKDQWIASQLVPTMTLSEMKERLSSDQWEWIHFEPVYKPIFKHGKVYSRKVALQAVFQEIHHKEKGLPVQAVMPVQSCQKFNRHFQKATLKANYGYGKYRVESGPGILNYRGKALYNTVLEACEAQMSKETTFMCPNTVTKRKTVVSKVGALVTIVSQTEGGSGCGPSFSDINIQTKNLRTGQSLALTDYFEEASLVAALRSASKFQNLNESFVKEGRHKRGPHRVTKLEDLDFGGLVLGGFAIDQLHLSDQKIRVRIALLEPGCGDACADDFTWLGLEVKPTKKFLKEYRSLQIQRELYAQD